MPQDPKLSDRNAIVLDTEKYRHLLEGEKYSRAQQEEYIQIVWNTLMQAMLLGIQFEFDAGTCGQNPQISFSPPVLEENTVELKGDHFHSDFNETAGNMDLRAEKGSS